MRLRDNLRLRNFIFASLILMLVASGFGAEIERFETCCFDAQASVGDTIGRVSSFTFDKPECVVEIQRNIFGVSLTRPVEKIAESRISFLMVKQLQNDFALLPKRTVFFAAETEECISLFCGRFLSEYIHNFDGKK